MNIKRLIEEFKDLEDIIGSDRALKMQIALAFICWIIIIMAVGGAFWFLESLVQNIHWKNN